MNPDSEARVRPWQLEETSGHTENLRDRLKRARDAKGLTLREVAGRIAQRLGKKSHDPSNVSNYEKGRRQPPIDVMAAWARAVGYRLVVDLKAFEDPRVFVLVHPDVARVALELDSADSETRRMLVEMSNRVLGITNEDD